MLQRTITLVLLLLTAAVPVLARIPITGRVAGPDGKPMTRAAVTLEPILASHDRAALRLDGKPGPDPVARSRPDASGIFEIAAPEVGMWKVVVSAPGHVTMEMRLVPLIAAEHLPALKLRRATDLVVRLVDGEGTPHPGRVGVFTTNVRGNFWRPSLRLADAGDDGVARLPKAAEEELQLEALAPGFPLATADVGAGEESLRLQLAAGVSRSVRFVDPRKRPVAAVLAYHGSALLPLGTSDDEGRLSVVLPEKDAPALRASTADLLTGIFALEPAEGDSAGSVEDLQLKPPMTLRGNVVDASNRDPVAGALVWAVRGRFAVTDARGRFVLAYGDDPPRTLLAAAEKYQRGWSNVQSAEALIALEPAVGLRGRVVDAEGNVLAAVGIEVRPLAMSGRFGNDSQWIGETSRRGAFEIHGLSAGVGYEAVFEKPGYAPERREVAPLEPFKVRSGLEVVLRAGRHGFGRVVDEDEAPIAGAEVVLERTVSVDPLAAQVRRFAPDGDPEDEETRLTDGEGRFELVDLGPGRYDLEVTAAGYSPARVPGLQVEAGVGEIDFGTVVLVPGASIEGRVTDPDDKAIAEAEIVVRTTPSQLSFAGPSAPVTKRLSGGDGRFAIGELTPGQLYDLGVAKEGYGSATLSAVRAPNDEPVTVVLQPSGRLSGRVVNRQGSAIENAFVTAIPETGILHRSRRPPWARSDADGRFVLEDVDPATLQVSVRAATYQTKSVSGVEVAPGEDREIEIVLDSAAVVDGRVTDAGGDPEVRVSVHFMPQGNQVDGRLGSGGTTDADGRFHVEDAPAGPVHVTVVKDAREVLKKAIALQAGTNTVDLVLAEGFRVQGTVLGPDGSPAAAAALLIQLVSVSSYSGTPHALSAGDGSFTIADVAAGRYQVTATKNGYAQARSEAFDVDGDVGGLVLELHKGVTLKGRVVGLELDELGSLNLAAFNSRGGGMTHGQADFESRYTIGGLSSGSWHVQAHVASSNRTQMLRVEIPEGVTELEKDIEFGTGFALTGVVLDGGEPLAGASIFAVGSMSGSGQSTTDSGGRFRIDHLPAGTYQILVSTSQAMRHTETLALAADRDLRIELFGGQITGRLFDAVDGTPVSGAKISVERLDVAGIEAILSRGMGATIQASSDPDGAFRLPKVEEGAWRVIATRTGYISADTTVAVRGGGTADVELPMTPTEGVSFEVAMASGHPPPILFAALLDPGGRQLDGDMYQVVEGRVRITTVPPGRWELVVQGGDSAAVRVTVDAPGDQGRIVLPAGGSLSIEVPELADDLIASVALTGPDGKPLAYPFYNSVILGEMPMHGGKALVQGLTAGAWSLVVRHQDGRTWSGTATVTPGSTTEVTLR